MSDSGKKPHDHSGHGHDSEEDQHSGEELVSLAPALLVARSGLRSDVQVLLDALGKSHVYIPLSEDLPDTPDGEKIEMKDELTFRPHMILNEDHSVFAVAYTEPALVDPMQKALDWKTSDDELKFICAPAEVAFDLAQLQFDGENVAGLVFNPGTDEELILQRDEVASLAQGKALPLVGYVSDLEPGADEETELLEGADPPPRALMDSLNESKEKNKDIIDVSVHTTFNPERDREPHLSILLTVIARTDIDRQKLADAVMDDAAPHLPAPGYADIIFREAPN